MEERSIFCYDSSLFRIFDIPLPEGEIQRKALSSKKLIILTEAIVQAVFSTGESYWKSVLFNEWSRIDDHWFDGQNASIRIS